MGNGNGRLNVPAVVTLLVMVVVLVTVLVQPGARTLAARSLPEQSDLVMVQSQKQTSKDEKGIPAFIKADLQKGRDLCKIWNIEAPGTEPVLWWQYACLFERLMDGPKDYKCKETKNFEVYKVCMDEPYRVPTNCLVYSFGINNEWGFDDAMAKYGCTVYAFDPSMNKPDHQRSERVFFKDLGISDVDSDSFPAPIDSYVQHITTWKIRTLKTLMKELGHANRTLDVLKIDIEASEWAVLENLIKDDMFSRVRQFVIEWHFFSTLPSINKFKGSYELMKSLSGRGLKFFFSRTRQRYHHFNYFQTQGDMSYVNTNFKG